MCVQGCRQGGCRESVMLIVEGHFYAFSLSFKEWRANNNNNNLAEWMTNLLGKVNFSFPLQLHFFLLLHNESELTINTFSHCLLRRFYLFALLFFFDYQPFPPSPLLLTPASVSRAVHASVPRKHHSFTSSTQSSWRPLLRSCALEKGKGLPWGAACAGSCFHSWNKVYESPIKKNM